MPTHNQKTVNIVPTERSVGSSDSETLKAIFSTSPIHLGQLTVEERLAAYQDLISNGVNDGGHTFGTLTFDYVTNGAPSYDEVKAGSGGGEPHNARVPNPSSVGEGNDLDSTKQPAAPTNFASNPSNQFGSGPGSNLQPKQSSNTHSNHTLKDYNVGSAVGKEG